MDFAIITHSLLPFLAENVESLAVDWILNSLTSFLQKDSLYEQCTEKETFSRKAKQLNLYAESLPLFFSNYSHILYSNVETFLKCSFTIMKNVQTCDVSDLSDFLVNVVQILLSILAFLAEVKQGLNSESLDLLHNNATEIESWKMKIDCSKSEIDEFSESKNTSTRLKELQNLIDTFFVKYRTSFGASSRSLDSNLPARNPTDEKLSSEEKDFREAFGLMHEALLPLRAAGMKNVSKLVKNGKLDLLPFSSRSRKFTELQETIFLESMNEVKAFIQVVMLFFRNSLKICSGSSLLFSAVRLLIYFLS